MPHTQEICKYFSTVGVDHPVTTERNPYKIKSYGKETVEIRPEKRLQVGKRTLCFFFSKTFSSSMYRQIPCLCWQLQLWIPIQSLVVLNSLERCSIRRLKQAAHPGWKKTLWFVICVVWSRLGFENFLAQQLGRSSIRQNEIISTDESSCAFRSLWQDVQIASFFF